MRAGSWFNVECLVGYVDRRLRESGYGPSDPKRVEEYFREDLPIEFCLWHEKLEQDLALKSRWRELVK